MNTAIVFAFGLFCFFSSIPALADQLWSCDFEPNGEKCITGIFGNEIKTFVDHGIPALPGGGSYAVTAKNKMDVNSDDLQFYFKEHSAATQNLYGRVYAYIPEEWHASGSFANGLKFWGASTIAQDGTCAECIWTSIWWKAEERDGEIWLAPQHNREPTLSTGGRVEKPLTRGKWHYIEFHVQNNPNGTDLLETWIDADARSTPPTHRLDSLELFPATTDRFGTVSMNINWSGFTPPWIQEYYVDGMVTADAPIGDTYGLLVPEPSASILFLGLSGLELVGRRRRRGRCKAL